MSDEKPVIEGVSTEATPPQAPGQGEQTAPPPSAPPGPGYHEKPWGMTHEAFAQFMSLVCMGLERADRRQRIKCLQVLKPIIKQLNVAFPMGRPIEDVKKEIAEHEQKIKLIIPKGINPETLKEPPHA